MELHTNTHRTRVITTLVTALMLNFKVKVRGQRSEIMRSEVRDQRSEVMRSEVRGRSPTRGGEAAVHVGSVPGLHGAVD